MRAYADHGLDGETHARLRLSDRLVLCIVGNVWSAVEQLVNAMPAVSPDDAAILGFCMLLDDVAILTEERAWLDNFNCLG